MGRPPERAARLHFRTTSIFSEDAHGPGPGECWRTSAGGTGESPTGRSCNSCSLARTAGWRACTESRSAWRESKSPSTERRFAGASDFSCNVAGKGRFAHSRRTIFGSNWIAFPGDFCYSITISACYIAGASGFSCNVSTSTVAEGTSRFAISSSSRGKCKCSRISKPGSGSVVASADGWRTTDVLRRLASCSSLFAAQYQRRFGHALLSLSLSNAPHQ